MLSGWQMNNSIFLMKEEMVLRKDHFNMFNLVFQVDITIL